MAFRNGVGVAVWVFVFVFFAGIVKSRTVTRFGGFMSITFTIGRPATLLNMTCLECTGAHHISSSRAATARQSLIPTSRLPCSHFRRPLGNVAEGLVLTGGQGRARTAVQSQAGSTTCCDS